MLIGLGLIVLAVAYNMDQRSDAQLLWGYRPLVLFSAAWALLILALSDRFSRLPQNKRLLGLSTLSGLLLAVGFPDLIPFPLLMFVGFVPLLMAEREISEQRQGAARWQVFKYSYHTFVTWNIITTYWVANTALVAGIVAILMNSAIMTIPFLLFHQTRQVLPRLGYAAFVAYWLVFEYVHMQWELTWPWLTLGNSFAEYPAVVQWYEYTGHLGGSVWALAGNVLALHLYDAWRKKGGWPWSPFLRLSAWVLLPVGFSLWLYFSHEEKGPGLEVVVVQPNMEPHYEKFSISEAEQIERFLKLAGEKVTENTEYVVFPETAFGFVNRKRINSYPVIRRIREYFADYPGLKIVTGIEAYYDYEPGYPKSRATRERQTRDGRTIYYEIYNAAIQITIGEEAVPFYKKSKLVPGPEIFPYPQLFFFFKPVIDRLEGTVAGVATQSERSVLSSPVGEVAPVICYESVFGEYHAGYIRKGADAIFIMTNDGWWDNTAGHRQHLYFASLRAIETRRAVARSANTGISAFLNQRGDIFQPTQYDEPVAIRATIRFNDEITLYVRYGDLVARIALFVSILLLLNTLVKRVTGKDA